MVVFNLIGIDSDPQKKAIQYPEIAKGFDKIGDVAGEYNNASVHIQKDSFEKNGVDWEQILPIITATLLKRGLNVFIYEAPKY
jgi:hypothetical protein